MLYGKNAKLNSGTVFPSEQAEKGTQFGRTRFLYDEYDLVDKGAALADGDVIKLFDIPANARVVDVILNFDDVGAAGSFSVGKIAAGFLEEGAGGTDVGTFFNSVTPNGAASIQDLVNGAQATNANTFYKTQEVEQIGIKVTTNVTNQTGILRVGAVVVMD
jgi:hypothetical protein